MYQNKRQFQIQFRKTIFKIYEIQSQFNILIKTSIYMLSLLTQKIYKINLLLSIKQLSLHFFRKRYLLIYLFYIILNISFIIKLFIKHYNMNKVSYFNVLSNYMEIKDISYNIIKKESYS